MSVLCLLSYIVAVCKCIIYKQWRDDAMSLLPVIPVPSVVCVGVPFQELHVLCCGLQNHTLSKTLFLYPLSCVSGLLLLSYTLEYGFPHFHRNIFYWTISLYPVSWVLMLQL